MVVGYHHFRKPRYEYLGKLQQDFNWWYLPGFEEERDKKVEALAKAKLAAEEEQMNDVKRTVSWRSWLEQSDVLLDSIKGLDGQKSLMFKIIDPCIVDRKSARYSIYVNMSIS